MRTVASYPDAGFDEVYVNQIGPDQKPFFDFYRTEVLPRLRAVVTDRASAAASG